MIKWMKNNNKYEFHILQIKEKYANEKLQRYQNDGWEIGGDILIKNTSSNGDFSETCVHIPLKRKIK